MDRDIQTLEFISPGTQVPPCCQLGLCLELFVYSVMCNLFPQGRSAKMVHLTPSRAFFPFYFFKTQANPPATLKGKLSHASSSLK